VDTLIEILRKATRIERFDEDGDPVRLELLPAMTDHDLEELQSRLPCAIPQHIRELLKFCRGFEGSPADPVDLSGQLPFAHEDIFPHGLPVAGDGFGNFWVVDLNATSADFGPIYFACHDPPVVALQSVSFASFLDALLIENSENESMIHFVDERATSNIWRADPFAVPRAEVVGSTDSELRAFAARLPEGFLVADLRGAKIGDGFSWGRFGHNTRIVRHSDAVPIFAYGPNK